MKCEICNTSVMSNVGLSTHLRFKHGISIKEYKLNHLKIQIPLCKCGNSVKFVRSYFTSTCGSNTCKAHKVSDETKEKLRCAIIKRFSNRTENSPWSNRAKRRLTYGESIINDELIKIGAFTKYDIVYDYVEYPYVIDFAFINEKVAVEFDGAMHYKNGSDRIEHDIKKDEYLINNGWRMYRVPYFSLNTFDINHLIEFVGNPSDKHFGPNLIKYKELLVKKEQERVKLKNEIIKSRAVSIQTMKYSRNVYLALTDTEIARRLALIADIDFSKWGSTNLVASRLNVSHTQARRFLTRFMNTKL